MARKLLLDTEVQFDVIGVFQVGADLKAGFTVRQSVRRSRAIDEGHIGKGAGRRRWIQACRVGEIGADSGVGLNRRVLVAGAELIDLLVAKNIGNLILKEVDGIDHGPVVDDACAAIDDCLSVTVRSEGKGDVGSEVLVVRGIEIWPVVHLAAQHVAINGETGVARVARLALSQAVLDVGVQQNRSGNRTGSARRNRG